jgi:hypothetical protein
MESLLEIKQDDFGDAVFEILKRNLSQPVVVPDAIALMICVIKNHIQSCFATLCGHAKPLLNFDVRNHKVKIQIH